MKTNRWTANEEYIIIQEIIEKLTPAGPFPWSAGVN
jgi:hypothetical protein